MTENSPIQHANDKLFKRTFQIVETVQDYLTYFAPEVVRQTVDPKKLTLDNTNYVSSRMAESFSDAVYRCGCIGSTGVVVLLFEHKSAPEQKPQRQLLKYQLAIWDADEQQKREESTIVSIVFYQGKLKWVVQPLAFALKNAPPRMEEYFPDFKYELLEVEQVPDEFLLRISEHSILAAMMLLMKKGGDRAFIYRHFAAFFKFKENRPEWNQILIIFVEYLLHRNAITVSELQELSKQNRLLSQNMKAQLQEAFISTAEQLKREGEAIGEIRGEAKGKAQTLRQNIERLLLRKVLPEAIIAETLEVELSFVQSIKADLIKDGRLKE